MSEGMSVVSNSPMPGLLKVAVYGGIGVSNDGFYVSFRFTTTGNAGTNTPLTISGFRVNDGADEIIVTNGVFDITRMSLASSVSLFSSRTRHMAQVIDDLSAVRTVMSHLDRTT